MNHLASIRTALLTATMLSLLAGQTAYAGTSGGTTANDDEVTVEAGGRYYRLDVLENDSTDAGPLRIGYICHADDRPDTNCPFPSPQGGRVLIDEGLGAVLYIPNRGTTSDTFGYYIQDKLKRSTYAKVTITVTNNTNKQDLPTARSDQYIIKYGSTDNALDVLTNDVDPDNDPLLIANITRQPTKGTVRIDGSKTNLVYTPNSSFAGLDSLEYEISDGRGGMEKAQVTLNVTDQNGWSVFAPSPDTKTVYVSSSSGDDNNDGLSEGKPVKTLSKGYSLIRHGYPDHMLLKKGDRWYSDRDTGALRITKGGPESTKPIVIGSYGTSSERPALINNNGAGSSDIIHRSGGSGNEDLSIDNVVIDGLEISEPFPAKSIANGLSTLGSHSNWIVSDTMIKGMKMCMTIQNDTTGAAYNFMITRSLIMDCYAPGGNGFAHGIYADGITNLMVHESLIHHNGWDTRDPAAIPTVRNHNFYITATNANVRLLENISSYASSHSMNSGGDSIMINNLSLNNPIGMFARHPSKLIDNVILGSRDNEAPHGYGIMTEDAYKNAGGELLIQNNLIAHKKSSGNHAAIFVTDNYDYFTNSSTKVTGNVIYDWKTPGIQVADKRDSVFDPVFIYDNTIVEPNSNQAAVSFNQVKTLAGITQPTSSDLRYMTFTNNKYDVKYNTQAALKFFVDNSYKSFGDWKGLKVDNDKGSTDTEVKFPPVDGKDGTNRTAATYNAAVKNKAGDFGEATDEAFIEGARLQSKDHWDPKYTAAKANAWIRAGYGMGGGAGIENFTITASAGAGGGINPSGSVPVAKNANQSFAITPNSGYNIASVVVDGNSVGTPSSYTFNNVTANHSISATFAEIPPTEYTITATAGPNGSITPSGSVTVNEGADKAFSIAANSGYVVQDVVVDGTSVGAVASYNFDDVDANHSISASFVSASVNQPPEVDAGDNKTVTTGETAALDATVSDDGLPVNPGKLSLMWTKVSGSGNVSFSDRTSADTDVTFSRAGKYVLRLTANDGAMQAADDIVVTVLRSNARCIDADINHDGFVTADDFDEFMKLYEAKHIRADINRDGKVDEGDKTTFVAAFEKGHLCTTR